MPRAARMHPSKRAEIRARDAEYQALWQGCQRTARRQEYTEATVPVRVVMLREALTSLMERRRLSRKLMCNTNIEVMIERHLGREAVSRIPIDLTTPYPTLMGGRGYANNSAPPAMSSGAVHLKREIRSRSPTPNKNLFMSNDNEGPSSYYYPPPPVAAESAPLPSVETPPVITSDYNAHQLYHHPSNHPMSLPHDDMSRNGPEAHQLESGRQYATLYDELAACRADRCHLTNQLRGLENKMEHISSVVSVLCMQLRPSADAKPQISPQTGLADDDETMKWATF
ncbi:hypothetical protein AK830_g12084 [Neonectria ditissima]|uniref:Uncharacterized protein n=1 Tax=Neonectria ditissima TaxID=78410 RepID=A0A0P7AQ44_9HYPO|nr:hypothetical protein AK830_g12084 [Neonectria ditissima]